MVNTDLSFSNIVKDLEVNEMAWLMDELVHTSPDRLYVIVFTARSGSSWLTNVLSETKLLGFPEEYLNPNFVRGVAGAVNSTVPEDFLAGLQRRRKTPNGVFGLEAREMDIELFGADCFFQIFDDNAVFFNLWRENIVAQAVSLFRAVETQQFHVKQGEQTMAPPAYNTKSIGKWMIHLAMQENANLKMLVQRQRPFINLCYEEMVKNRKQTQRIFATALNVELPPEALMGFAERPLVKIGNDWNDETERRFRAEAATLVSKVEANRKIKSHIPERANGEWIQAEPAIPPVVVPLRMVRLGS
jgi:LPS sulfotransferase NodH